MRKSEDLFAQANAKATAALEVENPDEAIALAEESERLLREAKAAKAASGVLTQTKEPQRPVDLPTGNDTPAVKAVNPARQAVYTLRYGQQDAAVKAVLSELYGEDYYGKRWEQREAFRRYLRGGEHALKSGDRSLLSEVILTPEYAIQAIQSGQSIPYLKAVMVEAQGDLGGYVVPVDFQAEIIKRLQGLVVMRQRARIRSTSRDRVEYPVATGGNSQYSTAVRVTWVDETPTAGTAATNLTFGQESIPVHTVMAEAFVSQNNLEDAAYDLEDALAEGFAEAAAIDEDNQFLTGDGSGKPQGLLPSSANDLSLTEANSGNASALTWDGLIDLVYAPDTQYRSRCVFIGEKATYKAIAKLKDGNGQYLWRDRFGNNVTEGGEVVRLMGYDTFEQEAMPTIAASAYPLLFGDPTGYTIVDRIGMTIRRFEDSSTARINQVCFVMRRRLGGQPTETWKWAAQKVSA